MAGAPQMPLSQPGVVGRGQGIEWPLGKRSTIPGPYAVTACPGGPRGGALDSINRPIPRGSIEWPLALGMRSTIPGPYAETACVQGKARWANQYLSRSRPGDMQGGGGACHARPEIHEDQLMHFRIRTPC